jgi:hypothetical protein
MLLGRLDGNQPLQRCDGEFTVTSGIELFRKFRECASRSRVESLSLRNRPFVEAFCAD